MFSRFSDLTVQIKVEIANPVKVGGENDGPAPRRKPQETVAEDAPRKKRFVPSVPELTALKTQQKEEGPCPNRYFGTREEIKKEGESTKGESFIQDNSLCC